MDINDTSDLLGNDVMPVRQHGVLQVLRALLNLLLGISVLGALVAAAYNGHGWLLTWREHNYKKSIRRKYGIPDDDNEPFNVAYAKAQQRRKEMSQKRSRQPPSQAKSTATAQDASSAGAGPSMPRRRAIPAAGTLHAESSGDSSRFTPQQNPPSKTATHVQTPSDGHAVPNKDPNVAAQDYATTSSQRKRSLEKDEADESSKKSRNDHEPSDSTLNDLPMVDADDSTRGPLTAEPSRGAKRQAGSDEDIVNAGSIGKKAGKRARRQSRKFDDSVDVDENDEFMDIDNFSRGKKRDRTEVESSFGGDDDVATESRGRKTRRQTRKSNASVDVEAAVQARGTKRGYDVESTLGSDNEEGSLTRSKSPRKRGRRMAHDSHDASKLSSEESVQDASSVGRKIGEEWTANGITYKLDSDGRRLRQVLLRKRASRFHMPEDSQHPDSQARLEILVETWLDDNQFKAAEKRGEVYVSNKKSKKTEEPSSTVELGKQLLWSPKRNGSISSKNGYNDSIIITSRMGVDPFARPSLTGYAKRVSIGLESPVESPTGSPSMRPSKSYSKWEKQDLEAEAMAKLRKKLEEEKKVATPISKKVTFQIPSSNSDTSASAPSIVSSSSAPASLPASGPSKTGTPASVPLTNKLFASSPATTDASKTATPISVATAGESYQAKPPVAFTAPQSSTQPSSLAPKYSFGAAPSGAQPTATENKQPTKAADQVTAEIWAVPSMPGPFGQKAQETSNAAAGGSATNMFSKPAVPNASASAPSGASGGAPSFPFGIKGAAQGEKSSAPATAFSLGKPSQPGVSSTLSPFVTPATNGASSAGSNTANFGSNTGSAARPTMSSAKVGWGAAPSQFSSANAVVNNLAALINKPAGGQRTSGTTNAAPKFNFGLPTKPILATSSQPPPTAQAAPKPASSASPFTLGSNSAAQNGFSNSVAPTSSTSTTTSTASAPKFSFGTPAQPSSSAMEPQAPATNTSSGNVPTTSSNAMQTSAPTSTGFFQFGGAKPAAAPSGNSPAPSSFGTTAKPSAFGNSSASSSPFGATSSSFGTTAKPSGSSAFGNSSATSSPFGAAVSAFGNANNAATSSPSPFGAAAKPAGETPKPTFSFGSSNPASTGTSSAPKQENKPAFSFNFGAASSTSAPTPTFGLQSGKSTGSAFGSTAGGTNTASPFGSAAGSSAPNFSFGAKPAFGTSTGNTNNAQNTNAFGSSNGTSAFGGQK